ncbi:YcaO-like family protein [Kribbella sp. CA-294648]|uniref:YcaO-like family protein n=1 Tax=Kribbella sp. CA-294648 TaxID=3239948 RepID=UPI003D94D779
MPSDPIPFDLFTEIASVPEAPVVAGQSDLGQSTSKAITIGTHRLADAETTWQLAKQAFSTVGISRVADLTMLDEIGIPVWQAVRPNAATLAVSQGKGISHDLARVSAAMEAIELWHAEQVLDPVVVDCVADLGRGLPYDIRRLHLVNGSLLTDRLRIPWIEGTDLLADERILVPRDYVFLNDVQTSELRAPLFVQSSNGLASGNSLNEAILHGLLEALERDMTSSVNKPSDRQSYRLALDSIGGACSGPLVDRLRSADIHLRVIECGSSEVACFAVSIWSAAFPFVFDGFGCHFDSDVAMTRALTEAAQSRLTAIAGARDDLPRTMYREAARGQSHGPPWPSAAPSARRFADIPTTLRPSIEEDLEAAVLHVAERTGQHPVAVDLSHPDVGLPVVRLVTAGLTMGGHRST